MQIFAVLPAAGQSLRMGQPKLALPLGEGNVLQAVLRAGRAAGVQHALVVLGPHVADLAASVEQSGGQTLVLSQPTDHMRQTIEAGLRWMEANWRPEPEDAWLLIPADHPTVQPAVILALRQALLQRPEADLALPTFAGRRGHPTLIRWRHAAGLFDFPADQGVNKYLRQLPGETVEVPWSDEDVLLDLDTPADYERLKGRWLKEA